MFKVALIVAALVSCAAATTVCPQALTDDTQLLQCATNSYGQRSVSQSQFANWNCNHPLNQYTITSTSPCATVAVPAACGTTNTCGVVGPTVCGRLNNPSGGLGYTVSSFANECQLTRYNCIYPAKAHTNLGHLSSCMSDWFATQVDNE